MENFATNDEKGKNSNNNNHNRAKRKEELRLKNHARAQQRYRERCKEKGFEQLNVWVPKKLLERLSILLGQDEKILEAILDKIESEGYNNIVKPTIESSKINETEAKNLSREEKLSEEKKISEEEKLFYTGDFSSKFKIMTEGYKVVHRKRTKANDEEIEESKKYIRKLKKLITETKNFSQRKAGDYLFERGYFTFNKEGIKIAPTSRGVEMMRLKLL